MFRITETARCHNIIVNKKLFLLKQLKVGLFLKSFGVHVLVEPPAEGNRVR